jgi:hypothetical protein
MSEQALQALRNRASVKNQLKTDINFLFDLMVQNNLDGVFEQIQKIGISIDLTKTPQNAKQIFAALINDGKINEALSLFNVPFIPGKLPQGYDEVITEVIYELNLQSNA